MSVWRVYIVDDYDKVVSHQLRMEYNKRFFFGVDSQINSHLHEQGIGTQSSIQKGMCKFLYLFL